MAPLQFPSFLPWRSGFRAARSSQGRAAVQARRSEPLTARTALKESREEGKAV